MPAAGEMLRDSGAHPRPAASYVPSDLVGQFVLVEGFEATQPSRETY